ncbi:MAG: hypothetical protein FWD48_02565 [Oscillospiraceae bacterium]|nr:hypothetical protein [Oscillospiraceae bacterium]
MNDLPDWVYIAGIIAFGVLMIGGLIAFTVLVSKKQKKKEQEANSSLERLYENKRRTNKRAMIVTIVAVALLVLIFYFVPEEGEERSNWTTLIFLGILTVGFTIFGNKWSKKLSEKGKAPPLPLLEERTKLDAPCKISIKIEATFGVDYKVFLNGNRAGDLKKGESLTTETEYAENQIAIVYSSDTIQREFNFNAESGGEKGIVFDAVNVRFGVLKP